MAPFPLQTWGGTGGLTANSDGTVTGSYWDTTTSGQAGGAGKTTSELQTPTAYGSSPSIYADWNINVDKAAGADDPWDFGTASQYPALKADFDGDGTPTAYEFGRQGRSAPAVTLPGPVSRIYGAYGEKALRFTWSAPTTTGPVETYDLELKRVAPSSMTTDWVTVGADITATRFDAKGLTPGAKYQVRIRAWNADGCSTWTAAEVPKHVQASFQEGESTVRSIDEGTAANTNIGAPLTADFADLSISLTYQLGGTDGGDFAIDAATGQLRTKSALSRGTKDTYQVRVVADDGIDGNGNEDIFVTIRVTRAGVNDPPYFSAASAARSVAEGTQAGSAIGAPVAATDPEGDTLTYTLGGTDVADFDIDSATGQIKTKSALDYDNKDLYQLEVEASDGKGGTASIDVAIRVTDATPGAVRSIWIQYHEKAMTVYWNATAIGGPVETYELQMRLVAPSSMATDWTPAGNDIKARRFKVEGLTPGARYQIRISGINGDFLGPWQAALLMYIHPSFQEGETSVRFVDEGTAADTNIGAPLTADFADPSISLTYQLGGTDGGDFDIDGATGQLKTKSALSRGTKSKYLVRVVADDGLDGNGNEDIFVTIHVTRAGVDEAPVFPVVSATRSVAENTPAGTNIGAPVGAVDPEGAILTYVLGGANAKRFDMDTATGQLKTKSALDYERKTSYRVSVTADDGNGNTTLIDVAIRVTDVAEPPTVAPGSVTATPDREGLNVSWTVPTADEMAGKPPVNGFDVQYRERTSTRPNTWGAWQNHPHSDTSVSAQIRGLTVGVTYGVRVRATNAEGEGPFSAPATGVTAALGDHDADNNGLIEVDSLAKLNALRWDLDGNGSASSGDQANYAVAFPNAVAGMGCKLGDHDDNPLTAEQPVCTGYELTADLDFNTDKTTDVGGAIVIDSSDAYWNGGAGWEPISGYNTVFNGNGHTISNLFISRGAADDIGLFGAVNGSARFYRVGLEDVNVTGRNKVGALVGHSSGGRIRDSYVTGSVAGATNVGGLVGEAKSRSEIRASYSRASVDASGARAGGLVGSLRSKSRIIAAYATGTVDGSSFVGGLVGQGGDSVIVASYSTGAPTTTPAGGGSLGGLIGKAIGMTITDAYWDATASGQASSDGGASKTTAELQTPTAYGSGPSIYAAWNVDVDNADKDKDPMTEVDDPWDFGTANQYPALQRDFNRDGRATAQEFGPQAHIDYDTDNDGLIDVDSLAKLNALRWDLNGDGSAAAGSEASYATAFPFSAAGMGCKLTDHDSSALTADQPVCTGYELTADLDFNTDTSTDTGGGIVIDDKDDYWNAGAGWEPIGTNANSDNAERYNGVFKGNGHTISNLFINRTSTDGVGLFGATGTDSEVRRVGLESVNVTGKDHTGGLAGNAFGDIRSSYTTGSVSGGGVVGGLVGYHYGADKIIVTSYSNAAVTASGDQVGGLVGVLSSTSVFASYATGDVTTSGDQVGGLNGNVSFGSIVASYATGAVTGSTDVGGLTGNVGTSSVVASYATGAVTGSTDVGGLLGTSGLGSTTTNSYWNIGTSGQATSAGGVWKTTAQLQSPKVYGGIYANWNVDVDNADNDNNVATSPDDPWDFGTASEYPVLKADLDGNGTRTWQEFGRQKRSAPPGVDHDTDDNGLIDVDSLAKLNALRWDLNGDGASTNANYYIDFPNPATGMGCKLGDHDDNPLTAEQPVCTGYELTADLDFNTDKTTDVGGAIVIDSSDAYWNGGAGWEPISGYNTVFNGNGHTISNLFISRGAADDIGLFGAVNGSARFYRVGLEDVNVTGRNKVGALVGHSSGSRLRDSYVTGNVAGATNVGGLVGEAKSRSEIRASYSNVNVDASGARAGGLVGYITQKTRIIAAYATGTVNGSTDVGGLIGRGGASVIVASYSTGAPTTTIAVGGNLGGLIGKATSGMTVTDAYWDATASGQASSDGGASKNTAGLQTPTAYGSGPSIYAAWNVDVDNADKDKDPTTDVDDPWDFGTANQYPALQRDFDGDGEATAQEFGRQRRAAPAANAEPAFTEGATAGRVVSTGIRTGRPVGAPIAATDTDGDPLTYGLGGTDAAYFTIDAATGQLNAAAALEQLDKNTKVRFSVDVTVMDQRDASGAADSNVDATITVTVSLISRTASSAKIRMDERAANVRWEQETPSDSIDAYELQIKRIVPPSTDPFRVVDDNIVGTQLTVRNLLPGAKYQLKIRGKNAYGVGPWGRYNLPHVPPAFQEGGSTTSTVAENTPADTNIGLPLTADYADATVTLTYSLKGTDANHFAIDGATGQLKTKEPLDHEGKSSYEVEVEVSDGHKKDSIEVAISVTDVAEPPSPPTELTVTPGVGSLSVSWVAPDAAAMDGKPPVNGYDVQYKLSSASGWTSHSHSGTGTSAQIAGLTAGSLYDVEVRAKNAEGDSGWISGSGTPTAPLPGNNAPIFTDGASTTRSVAENTPGGVKIGSPVAATDTDNDTLTYTLGGTNANHFAIDSATGQLQTKGALNYEANNSYTVTVTVRDGRSGSDSIDVTINVTDVAEPTTPPSGVNRPPAFITAWGEVTLRVNENTASGRNIGKRLAAVDPDGDTLTYELSGMYAPLFAIDSASGQLKTKGALDYEHKDAHRGGYP